MSPWADAGALIAAAFADQELVAYTPADGDILNIPAVVATRDLQDGTSARVYEFRAGDLPGRPTKQDTFTHSGRAWRILSVPETPNEAGGWELPVGDDGEAP